MANPVVLSSIAFGGSVGSGILGYMSSKATAKANSDMYTYQAGVAKINQDIAKQNADYSLKTGENEAQKSGMASRFQIGGIKTAQGASNLDVNSGSAADVRGSQQDIAQYDESIIRSNAAKRAYGYEVEETQQKAQEGVYKMSADKSIMAGDISAATSILSASTSVASKWLQGNQVGLTGGGSNASSGASSISYTG